MSRLSGAPASRPHSGPRGRLSPREAGGGCDWGCRGVGHGGYVVHGEAQVVGLVGAENRSSTGCSQMPQMHCNEIWCEKIEFRRQKIDALKKS